MVVDVEVRISRTAARRWWKAAVGALVSVPAAASLTAAAAAPPAAAEKATPTAAAAHDLLSKRCLSCHGAAAISGLDLRAREALLRGGKRGPALVPGKPEESRLYLVTAGRGEVKMPPAGALTADEQALLKRWIAEGAEFPSGAGVQAVGRPGVQASRRSGVQAFGRSGVESAEAGWALKELRRPPLPVVRLKGWVRSPIDAFVLAKLEAEGLKPTPEADRRTLIRRLSFDLTGLPPDPADVERFLADRTPHAWEKLVDRYLASPAYGERWARHWLDIVRFAESQGFERDKIRDNSWRYRDYVIRSFNQDKPYEQFVREQIAGDLLLHNAEGVIATGFLVAGPWDEVGNQQASLAMRTRVREDELEDMVSATCQTFLGLTVNCARCHDHKFDPIPQRDYYRIQAALAGVRHGDRSLSTPGEEAARTTDLKAANEESAALVRQLAEVEAAARRRAAAGRHPSVVGIAVPQPVARWAFESDARDHAGKLDLTLSGGAAVVNGRLRLNGVDGQARSAPLPFDLREKTLEAWVDLASLEQGGGSALTVEDLEGRAFDAIVFGERQPRKWVAGSDSFVRTLDLTAPEETSQPGELVHVAITYGADGRITVYRNGARYGESYVPAGTEPLRSFAAGRAHVLLGLRHSAAGTAGARAWLKGEIEEARLYDRALTPEQVEASFRGGPPVVTEAEMLAALAPDESHRRQTLSAALQAARAKAAARAVVPMAYAANPAAAPAVFVLKRGDINQKLEAVTPGGLSCIRQLNPNFALDAEAPDSERRRKLAEWITDPHNPLTPRVIANRVWQYHFGRGLAASPSDFGVNGEAPSHPELLDFLASVLVAPGGSEWENGRKGEWESGRTREWENGRTGGRRSPLSPTPPLPHSPIRWRGAGWRLKALHRLILTSATYRQASSVDSPPSMVHRPPSTVRRPSDPTDQADPTDHARHAARSTRLRNPESAPSGARGSSAIRNPQLVDADDRLLWRMPLRRLEAEEIRDAMLSVSGQLNPQAGGPGFRPFDLFINNSHFYTFRDKIGPEYNRRSIYRTVVNSGGIPLLETFDCPDPSTKTPRRGSTTTPLQALSLLNNSFVVRQAKELASRLEREAGADVGRQVERAYTLAFSRPPTAAEAKRDAAFVRGYGLAPYCRVLLNSSEFVYVR